MLSLFQPVYYTLQRVLGIPSETETLSFMYCKMYFILKFIL